jgi:Domain of unknown function (DUF2760)
MSHAWTRSCNRLEQPIVSMLTIDVTAARSSCPGADTKAGNRADIKADNKEDNKAGVERSWRYARRPVSDDPHVSLPPSSSSALARLWLACLCFVRVLFDGRFAGSVRALGTGGPADAPRLAAVVPSPAPSPAPRAVASMPAAAPSTPALQLLSLLQREGRLVDFLQQDITGFSDVDVGIAARVVHEGCRKALRAHAEIEPVRPEDEGARVVLVAGFDADAVKLVGEVHGHAPYAGVLRHKGWRARRFELPQMVGGHDAHVLAPAEVELG